MDLPYWLPGFRKPTCGGYFTVCMPLKCLERTVGYQTVATRWSDNSQAV